MLRRLKERLWVKPLLVCFLSIGAVLLARWADSSVIAGRAPEISQESLLDLLKIIAASMLVMATLAVGTMVAAYASTGSSATPRAFPLVIADDVSQNSLSTFLGAFIFSVVAFVFLSNGYYGSAGRFTLFALSLLVLAMVVLTFVRWVDRIARLGRLGSIIEKVESATMAAFKARRRAPRLRGAPLSGNADFPIPVHAATVGYVARVDLATLQKCAEEAEVSLRLAALPGTFATPDRPLVYASRPPPGRTLDAVRLAKAFAIGKDRKFDDDPRFGLVVLAEIAGRALSPAVNDPGTAIEIIGSLVRLFVFWGSTPTEKEEAAAAAVAYSRVEVPVLNLDDMFSDAFTPIARDGAGTVEVAIRLQKAYKALAATGHPEMRAAAVRHAQTALARAEHAIELHEELERLRKVWEPMTCQANPPADEGKRARTPCKG